MACKKCKKKATQLTNSIMGEKPKSKKCKDCKKTGIEKDMEWLDDGNGKVYNQLSNLLPTERVLIWTFGWIPLIIGYISIIRFFYILLVN